MGCAGSKSVEVSAKDVYRPPPTSISLFDISTVNEPWLMKTVDSDKLDDERDEEEETKKKPMHIPLPLLEKLESGAYELTPNSTWSEVSKALEDIKPSLHQQNSSISKPTSLPRISGSRLRENIFLVRDREEREKGGAGNARPWKRRDPLEGYPEIRPPGEGPVVLYTTTLRGVRRTYEECDWARKVVEAVAEEAGVGVDERDVALHGGFLREVRELLGEGAGVPRLFVMGRYVGGAEEVVELNDTGKLKEMMRWVAGRAGGRRTEGAAGRRDCEGCGNARFVPCFDCSGSCKVLGEDGKEVLRCGECNENGLIMCPLCHS